MTSVSQARASAAASEVDQGTVVLRLATPLGLVLIHASLKT